MTAISELKHQVHDLVDQLTDETTLTQLRGTLSELVQQPENDDWNDLTEAQRQRILTAYESSLNPANLISHDVVKQQFTKWLTR